MERVRHFGDPAAEYDAAVRRVAMADRSFRLRLRVGGRAPGQMLGGIVSGSIPPGPEPVDLEVAKGRRSYSAILTVKGRMVSDLRILSLDAGDASGTVPQSPGAMTLPSGDAPSSRLLLDVPAEGADGVRAHLKRYLPPRFATVQDLTEETGMITVIGPDAAELITREAMGLRVATEDLVNSSEDEYYVLDQGAGSRLHVIRTGEVGVPAFDLIGDRTAIDDLWDRLREVGSTPVGHGVWETLRVEAGRPAFGADMDEQTIPIEAGIEDRAIDHQKGCYTGQEIIVRIRDRGHVNRHLRGLRLGEAPTPACGTELFKDSSRPDRPVGYIRTAVQSPRWGETLALAYVRREVEPGDVVRVGGIDGPEAIVTDLAAPGGPWSGLPEPEDSVPHPHD